MLEKGERAILPLGLERKLYLTHILNTLMHLHRQNLYLKKFYPLIQLD